MKKFFTLAAALLASFSLWAATQTVTWVPTSEDVATLVQTTPTAVTVGVAEQSFKVYSVRPFYNANAVKLEWNATEGAIKTTDNAIDKSGLAVFIPEDADEVVAITVYMHQTNTRKSYFAAPAAEKPSNSGTVTDVIAKTSTGYNFWDTFEAGKYYAFGGRKDGSGELYYDSIKVTFEEGTPEASFSITPEEVTLTATAANPVDSAVVKIKGKNLNPGRTNFNITWMEGLTLSKSYITVGEDGKLDEEIVIRYAPTANQSGTIDNYFYFGIGGINDFWVQKGVKVNYSADFTKNYISKSLNIEQLVLDYGTKYDIKSALTDAGWAYASLDALDTLNDIENKAARNEPYLGLKLKTAGAYVQGWLKADGVLLVKFGNLGSNIKVTVKGATTDQEVTFTKEQLAESENVLPIYGYTEDIFVTISTTGSSTVVLKQLMLDEIAEVALPTPGAFLVTVAESENGKVEATWPNKKYRTPVGETVTLNITGVEGYGVDQIKVNDEPIEAVEGVYSFIMPATDVTVTATFKAWPTAIDNTEVEVKAVKVVRNGQVVILRDGKNFNVLGTELK